MVEKSIPEIERCLEKYDDEMTIYYNKCIENCNSPCLEEVLDVKVRYAYSHGNHIKLVMHYDNLQVYNIREVPRYELWSLVANVGGTLGLMTGMSAISLLEVFMYFVLKTIRLFVTLFKRLL